MAKRRAQQRGIAVTEAELFLVSDALAAYQKSIEHAIYLTYSNMTQKDRNAMTTKAIDAIDLRSKLHKEWSGEERNGE